jgi:serine/threonine protein kinase
LAGYIGEYEIRKELGRGGFGRVYLCFDPRVQRHVAIKVLNDIGDSAVIQRFQREAIATSNLNHPNIVTVYGSGEHEGWPYIVMQYLEGQDLYTIIRGLIEQTRTVTLLEKVEWMWQVGEGLLYAHNKQVVHRDVKPANIQILPDGTAKILDFGIAKVMGAGMTRHTEASGIIGTLSYMSPEQLTGGAVDALWDIWSYGVIYYELLTLLQPFRADNAVTVIDRVTHLDPEPLRTLAPECPESLERIVHRLLSRSRENRFQTLDDLQFEMAPVLKDLRAQEASNLLNKARDYMRDGKLEELPNTVRRILDLDPANAEARKFREFLHKETDKRRIGPKVTTLLQQAEKQAATRDFAGAMQSLDAAQNLNPEDASIRNFRVRLKTAWGNIQEAEKLVSQARNHLASGDPNGALRCINSASRLDRENTHAQQMLTDIRTALEEQEKARRLVNELSRVDVFIGIDALHEATELLNRLSRENPGSPEVAELSTRLLAKKKQRAVRDGLAATNEDLRAGRLKEAIGRLEILANEYPDTAEVRDRLSEVRDKLTARIREEYCRQVLEETEGLLKIEAFDRAIQSVTQALRRYPDQMSLVTLRRTVEARKSEHERALRLQAGLLQCEDLRSQGRLREARDAAALLARDVGESAPLSALREALNASILAAFNDALERASGLSREQKFEDALSVIRRALAELGDELRLRELMKTILDLQREAERTRAIQTSLGEVSAAEARADLDGGLLLATEAMKRLGPSPELETAAMRIRAKQSIAKYLAEIRRAIEARDWNAAQSAIDLAKRDHPAEPLWSRPSELVRSGRILSALEACLAGGDFEAASRQLKEARRVAPPIPGLDEMEARLAAAQQRLRGLRQAREAAKQGDFREAEQTLSGLRVLDPNDSEVLEALREVDELKEVAERRAHFESTHASARALLEERRFAEGIDLLEGLLQLEPGDPKVQEELRSARAEQERAGLRQATEEAIQSAESLARELSAPLSTIFAALDRVDSLARRYTEIEGRAGPARPSEPLGMEAFQERATRLRNALEALQSVQEQIRAQNWAESRKRIDDRERSDPAHAWFWENAAQRWQQELTSAMERALAEGELSRAGELLNEARVWEPPMAAIPALEAQLARLESRNNWLRQAREIVAQGRTGETDLLIQKLPQESRNDPEVRSVLQSVQAARLEAERQAQRREVLVEAAALRSAGQFEEALDLLQRLAARHPADAEVTQALVQTLDDQRAAERASLIEESKMKASVLLKLDNPGAVVNLLRSVLRQVGEDPQLREILKGAEASQRELERAEGIAACLKNAAGLEQTARLNEALGTLNQGLERWGAEAKLEAERDRIAIRKDVEDRKADIGRKIGGSAWEQAEAALTQAVQAHPGLSIWRDLGIQLRNGRVQRGLELNWSKANVTGLGGLIEEAREFDPPMPDLRAWEERLAMEQARRAELARAAALRDAQQYPEAERILQKVLEIRPGDAQARRLLQDVRKLSAAQDRTLRFDQARAEIQQFRAAQQFDAALGALELLVREFPERVELREEMRETQREKEGRLREEERASGQAEAKELVRQGDFNGALRRYRALLKRFPGDAALEEDRAAAAAAKDADEIRRKATRERERAEKLIGENRFDEALKILDPLIREFPRDADLRESWRSAMAGRGTRSDWLDVYERLAEIEDLYHKGKARQVRDNAKKILEAIEEPRARWFLEWAEEKLKDEPEPTSARESLTRWLKDKFK